MTTNSFRNDRSFLSNYYQSPIVIEPGHVVYDTAEHLYQTCKTDDPHYQEWIRVATKPGEAKRRGRRVPIRSDWEKIKLDVMRDVLRLKFDQHPGLKQKLLDTGDEPLLEINAWRRTQFWSIDTSGVGENWLGKLLMELRAYYREDGKS